MRINLSALFIKRPIMTLLVMATILFFGILSYQALPVSDLPNVDYPTIQVTASYPGADPSTMANSVTVPLEKKFTTVQDLISISSTTNTGSTTIVLQFTLDRSIDAAAQDVQSAINQASEQLPQNLPYAPTYTKVNPSDTPILFLVLSSATMPLGSLYDYADTVVAQRLNIVPGVSQVLVYGYPYAVRVQLDPQKLAAKGLGLFEVGNIIKSQNAYIPTGTVFGGRNEFTIDVDGQISQASGYNPMILKVDDNGGITRLQDVGQALDSIQEDKFYAHYVSKDKNVAAVVLAIQKQPGANALTIIDQINTILPRLETELPGSVSMDRFFDKSEFIHESVADVQMTVLVAFILVVIIIFLYLGRPMNTLIPTLALPMSIVGTFIFMYLFNFTIDILSLLAISLSIGFLVDDAIVVLENIVRHVEMGETPMQAALNGSKEISFTVLSMTLCLISVFIPMLFMSGIVGKIFFEFAVTIVTAVLISGVISLSLTPMLCSRLVPPHHGEGNKTRVEKMSEKLNDAMVRKYSKGLEWVLGHRLLIVLVGIISVVAAVAFFQRLPKDLFPPDDLGLIQGLTQSKDGTSTFQMIEYQKTINEMIRDNPAIDGIISVGAYPTDNQGVLYIHLKPYQQRPPILDMIHSLYAKLYDIPGVKTFLKTVPLIDLQVGTTATTGDYQYTLQSIDPDALYSSAVTFYQKMQKLPGFSQVYSDLQVNQPQLRMNIQRDKASLLGITASDIENALSIAFANFNLSPINMPDNQYYVITEVLPKFYRDPSQLAQIYVRSQSGDMVPLNEIVTMKEDLGPLTINHIDGIPSVTISFNISQALNQAIAAINQLAAETLPPSITGSVQGTADVFQASFADMTFLLMITIFVIYVILGILYENFFHPITVMTSLPPAALGGLFTLFITQNTLSMYALVGVILLLGIVLKNGIILVDFANESIEKGMNPHDAVKHACLTRFRPILMTTISALMGALPIALGVGGLTAQSRRPLGLVIVGGLIFSQLMTLFLTPVVYLYLQRLKERIYDHKKPDQGLG
jgi:HAE1 family hydrophobic/amphiphilic exporter-1